MADPDQPGDGVHFGEAVGLLLLIIGLVWLKVPGMALEGARRPGAPHPGPARRGDLKLRQEAERLADIKVQREQAEKHAAEIVQLAQEEATRLAKDSTVKLEEQIKRRGEMAERRIALAEVAGRAPK